MHKLLARSALLIAVLATLALTACGKTVVLNANTALTPLTHRAFPIDAGVHAVDCAMCHGTYSSFMQFDCLGCHAQAPTAAVHTSVTTITTSAGPTTYSYDSHACYLCHQNPTTFPFDHAGITAGTTACAPCHDVGNAYAALPVAGFTHLPMNGADCTKCHVVATWLNAAMPAGVVADPAVAVTVNALIPRYSSTSIAQLSPQAEVLPMGMAHLTTQVNVAALACSVCHIDAATGVFYPGRLHSSLANLSQAQPVACSDCHTGSMPVGFVGPTATNPARTPSSGEMKHDAVVWSAGAPTTTLVVTADCGACHLSPSATVASTWATGAAGTSPARYHAALTAAGLPQPTSCVDCHANSRPAGAMAVTTAGVPAGVTFDHAIAAATGDCAGCHASTAVWSGAKFHLAGSTTPATCLPCHAGQRPTSNAGWVSAGYATSPFDYGTNPSGVTHGDGQDCVTCHGSAGTGGAWGVNQSFTGGHFAHGSTTVSAGTCITCHMSQRPDVVLGQGPASTLLGFDHTVSGFGDCIGCHKATVTAGTYVNYYAPGVTPATIKGGDWQGGSPYPGSTLISAPNQFVTITEITLQRASPGGLITGMTSIQDTLFNAMLHTSAQVPPAISAGTSPLGDQTKCAYCHTVTGTGQVSYPNGQFHSALNVFPASLGGPLPQPTLCLDCHAQMRPPGVVELGGSDLAAMDHSAVFTGTVRAGGAAVGGVVGLDCATCHHSVGVTWADGAFHASIALSTTTLADCSACHYPLMADGARANLASGTLYTMAHGSKQLSFQTCATCHTGALAASTTTPLASTNWRPGSFHASLTVQPTACIDCHMVSEPAANASTQSSWSYVMTTGGTSSNGGQWMNHGVASVAGLDCAACHAADAKPSGSAWSKADLLHTVVPNPTTCNGCHGLSNGGGTVPGTNNNMPAGLTSSTTLTTASANSLTGVPAGTYDQITHADVNVTAQACNFCHTQVGISTVTGVAGKEWAQAKFHVSFTAATPLVMNSTTGRCSNCHLNVKPGPSYTAQDHSAFTNVSGSQDCSACHSWPGAGGNSAPNWKGGGNMPQYITVGGFAISQPPASTATTQTGIANLPHPTPTTTMTCASCHTGGAGGKNAIGYDHASTLANSACSACHEAGSNLVGTVWNGATAQGSGAGDTRPFTITSLKATRGNGGGSCTITTPNQHFYPVQCGECHVVPTGTGPVTTGTAYTSAWTFPHTTSKMTNPSTCNLCHQGNGCGT